jgi:hypothetical protein
VRRGRNGARGPQPRRPACATPHMDGAIRRACARRKSPRYCAATPRAARHPHLQLRPHSLQQALAARALTRTWSGVSAVSPPLTAGALTVVSCHCVCGVVASTVPNVELGVWASEREPNAGRGCLFGTPDKGATSAFWVRVHPTWRDGWGTRGFGACTCRLDSSRDVLEDAAVVRHVIIVI